MDADLTTLQISISRRDAHRLEGTVRNGDESLPFNGWMSLLAALEELLGLADDPMTAGASPPGTTDDADGGTA